VRRRTFAASHLLCLFLKKTRRVGFGLFQADFQTGELWRSGQKIRLQTQPFRVLQMLLEHAGEVVRREELQAWIWEPGTNVDYERALAGAINKIREALGDSADNPRFVETLAKRGYRFIAPVQAIADVASHESSLQTAAKDMSAAPGGPTPVAANQTSAADFPASEVDSPVKHSRPGFRWALAGTATAILLAFLTVAEWNKGQTAPPRLKQLTFDSPISPGPPNPETLPSLITVGNRVITSVLIDGKSELASISTTTGEVGRISLPQELVSTAPLDVSRDGARLLVLSHLSSSSEQPLWIVPTEGGSALRVGDVLAHDATWMPDSTNILIASGNDLSVVPSTGGTATLFARLPGRAFWMRWSPDGKLLRFTLIDPLLHSYSLWELASGDKTPQRMDGLGNGHPYVCCGVWTADGSAYIFQKALPGTTDLWELRRGFFGSTLSQLTNGPLRYTSPTVARNGNRIYFLGSETPLGVQVFDPDRIEFVPGPYFLRSATRVSYSRDGVWVAWTDANGQLWRARASDGSEKLQLTPAGVEVFSASWAPDGRRLTLMARLPGQSWQIYLTNSAGGEQKQVLLEQRNSADPTWSADGRFLAIGGEPDLMGKEGGIHIIEIVDAQSGQSIPIPGSQGLFSPRWSPDGRWIVALTLDQKKIRLYDTNTRLWRDLATTSAADPVWSSDSKAVFVNAFLADQQPILRIDVTTGEVHRVADLTALRSKEPANYFFSGITPNNQPMVLPRVGTSNLYSLSLEP
jgi:Tol biopolymer transport system component/DNA-binding winged helix-turn-helix (wHTH) protein